MSGLDRVVILAGGEGKRLWPWTSPGNPKPLLPLGGGGRTLLGATLDRLAPLLPLESIRLQSARPLGERLIQAEPRLSHTGLWEEPSARDTGPAIALAMRRAAEESPQAVVAILPADQRIDDTELFAQAMRQAATEARQGALVILGIEPREPSTAFGYVEVESEPTERPRDVIRFVEKPDRARAEQFLAAGRHFWNAGIFVWRADRFSQALERFAPELAEPIAAFAGGEPAAWERTPQRSIDYLLMERAEGVRLVPYRGAWDDIGGWERVAALARDGEAGPVRHRPIVGPGGAGSIALTVVADPPSSPLLLLEPGPWLHVEGPRGTLFCRLGEDGAVKRWV